MIDRFALLNQLTEHEGLRLKPYRCTAGKLTIGVGRNLDDAGISAMEAMSLLQNDIDACSAQLTTAIPWWLTLGDVRQRVLLDMTFNLGIRGFLRFSATLDHVRKGEYEEAALSMLSSLWATQVGRRALRLSRMMASGKDVPLEEVK